MTTAKEISETRSKLESVNSGIMHRVEQLADSEEPEKLDELLNELADLVSLKKKTLVYLRHLKTKMGSEG
jgi:hypothetical protein